MSIRFTLPPGGDVPPLAAARRMGMSLEAFRDALPGLVVRGFPAADATTGNFDLDAIETWRRQRYPHLFPAPLTLAPAAHDAEGAVWKRLARIRGG